MRLKISIFLILPCCHFCVMSQATFSDQIRLRSFIACLRCAAECCNLFEWFLTLCLQEASVRLEKVAHSKLASGEVSIQTPIDRSGTLIL